MSDSSIVIIQGTVGLYTVATRCRRCFAVTLKYTEDSSLKILLHSLMRLNSDISLISLPLRTHNRVFPQKVVNKFIKFDENYYSQKDSIQGPLQLKASVLALCYGTKCDSNYL